jgi:hypothetical protein
MYSYSNIRFNSKVLAHYMKKNILIETSNMDLPGGKVRPEHMTDDITASYEQIV